MSAAERVLILAPIGRDAPLSCAMVREAGFDAEVCDTMERLAGSVSDEAGAGSDGLYSRY